jgi:hypothetical protein
MTRMTWILRESFLRGLDKNRVVYLYLGRHAIIAKIYKFIGITKYACIDAVYGLIFIAALALQISRNNQILYKTSVTPNFENIFIFIFNQILTSSLY